MPRISAPFFEFNLVSEKQLILLVIILGRILYRSLSRTQKSFQLSAAQHWNFHVGTGPQCPGSIE